MVAVSTAGGSMTCPWIRNSKVWLPPGSVSTARQRYTCWELEYIVYGNGIASVKVKLVKFCVVLEFLYVKN